MDVPETQWPHAPVHRLGQGGTFMLTAGTYLKRHHFRGAARLRVLQRGLLAVTREFGWHVEAWAVFSNHYHFVGHAPVEEGAATLTKMLRGFHATMAGWVNRLDGAPGRKVWHNYWETRLTYEKSYLARLHYTHKNAVKHGLVRVASHYPWCSAGWFEQSCRPAVVKTIYSFKTDGIRVRDDYDVVDDW